MQEKYGFVYIWYDRKHKRYYIGCHWGFEGDGYICSSSWMKQAYKRRPQDFKGPKILTKIYTTRQDLLKEEYKWLSFIKDEELGKKYYNLSKRHFGHWATDDKKRQSISERMMGNTIGIGRKRADTSERMKGNSWGKVHKGVLKPPRSEEHCKALSESHKGKPSPTLGRKWSEETRQKHASYQTPEFKLKKSIAIKAALAKKRESK